MARLLIDGYNLGLEKGTGVATYARNLSYEIGHLGHRVDVLYGNRMSTTRDDLLSEIYFFDGGGEERIRILEILEQIQQAIHGPLTFRAKPVPVTGRVITRTFASRLPHYDRLFNSPDLFARAQSAFKLWQRPSTIRLQEKPDLAHWTYPIPLWVKGRPNIYTLHDVVPLRLPYTTLDHKRRYLRLLQQLDKKAAHFVTVSENSKRDLVELVGIAPERITNTYQSVSIPEKYRNKPEDQVAREVEGLTGIDYKGYFLFWGSLEPKKNIGRMIEAYLSSQIDTPLVMVGAQAWKSEQELKLLGDTQTLHGSIERRRGARKRVVQLPYASFPLLVSLIRGARAALFPSLYEGFGLPALEAMLLGTPVICSNTSSLPEVTGEAAYAVDPYDTAGLTQAIRAIDADEAMRQEYAKRGLAQAARFSPDAYRAQLKAVYDRYL
ncbi:MAG: glycosyltransferase family 1 protein [Erythrobacter sp.]|uniref:glycosyltransferase family 4 protein n=1 Tax=Erythrobacter sp. TaxID=1042 RepID=UPI002620C02D|nr:glycosyltransferase family 1 protein [Erythrobacter sp.]MDJ0979100.1 glycosyltransferase family 1 protein [Erythrobacter sp.]